MCQWQLSVSAAGKYSCLLSLMGCLEVRLGSVRINPPVILQLHTRLRSRGKSWVKSPISLSIREKGGGEVIWLWGWGKMGHKQHFPGCPYTNDTLNVLASPWSFLLSCGMAKGHIQAPKSQSFLPFSWHSFLWTPEGGTLNRKWIWGHSKSSQSGFNSVFAECLSQQDCRHYAGGITTALRAWQKWL